MFEVKKEGNFSREERLLYNIWQELIRLNSSQVKEKVNNLSIKKENKPKTSYKCKTCNVEYENKGQMLACAKKHKKEGDNSGRSNISTTSKRVQ